MSEKRLWMPGLGYATNKYSKTERAKGQDSDERHFSKKLVKPISIDFEIEDPKHRLIQVRSTLAEAKKFCGEKWFKCFFSEPFKMKLDGRKEVATYIKVTRNTKRVTDHLGYIKFPDHVAGEVK